MVVHKKMNKLFLQTIITFFLLLATFIFVGSYYEEYESLFDTLLSGSLTPGSTFPSWYYMGHIGISHLYSQLYQTWGNIEWMSWILYGYLFISCSILLFWLSYFLRGTLNTIGIIATQIAVFIIVFADNVVHFQYTRISYFMCAASLLSLINLAAAKNKLPRKNLWQIIFFLFFIVSALTRLETSMAISGLLFCFAIYYLRNLKNIIKTFTLPLLVVGVVLSWILYDSSHTQSFYKQVEPDIETQLTARNNQVPLSTMHTALDSLKYQAAINMLWGDPEIITPTFLRSLIKQNAPFLQDKEQWERTYDMLREFVQIHWPLLFINMFIAILFLFYSGRNDSTLGNSFWVLFNLAFIALLVLQTYFVKINERSFTPLLSVYTTIIMLYAVPKLLRGNSYIKLTVAICLASATIHAANLMLNHVYKLQKEFTTHTNNMNILKQISSKQILVLNGSTIRSFTLCNKPFERPDYSAFKKIYINEAQVLPTIDAYKTYLEKECKCDANNFSNFFRYLNSIEGDTVFFFSDTTRMHLIQDYLSDVHGYQLNIKEVKGVEFERPFDHEEADVLSVKLYTFVK